MAIALPLIHQLQTFPMSLKENYNKEHSDELRGKNLKINVKSKTLLK